MTTHDTRSHLLAEIAASPDDDTLHLAFADWLDEHGDAADRDRAEFIRVQCELGVWSGRGHPREVELLSAHPEWSRCRCPECDGRGSVVAGPGVIRAACPTCSGTGDPFLRHVDDRTHATEPRTVTFARGFTDAVHCTLADAFSPDGDPTAWALAVVRQTPVTRLVMTNRTPERSIQHAGWFRWFTGVDHNEIPVALFRELEGEFPTDRDGAAKVPYWRTAGAATDALALAAGRVVRRHAYPGRK